MIDRPMPVRSAALQAKQPPIWRPKTPKTIANVAESKSASATTAKSCWESAEELAECRLYELAIQQYTQAVELDPELAGKAARRTAPLYAELKKTDQASHAYETAIMDHPNDVALLLEIGEFHHTGGRSSEAEKWLRKALEKSPDNEQALRTLSLLKTAPGNTSEAVDTLWRVMPAADSHMAADAHLATGNALAKSGKTAAAIDAYLKALNLEPPQSPAKSRADQPETMEPEEPAKVMWRAIAATGKKSFEE
jgi:tetratricopeptide (TPR) repeat protein